MTNDEIIDALVECGRVLDAQDVPSVGRHIWVPPWFGREMARARGAPTHRHGRARGARGRKRALMRSWRPTFHSGDHFEGVEVLVG